MRHLFRLAVVGVAVLSLLPSLLLPVTPVFAIADPDSPPQINNVWVYNDLLSDGDAGILIDYYLDYAAVPTETATDAYLVAFIDTDGTTMLRAVAPYTYVDSGYGHGYAWIYFTPAEVTAYTIDSADMALYRIWLMGNPTLSWAADPPRTVGTIDYWQPSWSDTAVLFALRILSCADTLELDWSQDMIEATSLGNKLTATGEEYFVNVVSQLRSMAPAAFASGTEDFSPEDIDNSLEFGAVFADDTGTATGSPIDLTEGANTVAVTAAGTFTINLTRGTAGTVESDTGTVTGSPVTIVWGVNTVTVPPGGTGDITVTVELDTQATRSDASVTGGALDVSGSAADWGLSRWMMGGMIWLAVSIIACAGLFKLESDRATQIGSTTTGASRNALLLFIVLQGVGISLHIVHPDVGTILIIGFGFALNYVLWLKPANV